MSFVYYPEDPCELFIYYVSKACAAPKLLITLDYLYVPDM